MARGKEHVANLEREAEEFSRSNSGQIVVEVDPYTLEKTYKFRLRRDIPDRLSVFAADAVESLRTALDNATFGIAQAAKLPPKSLTKFPFGIDANGLEQTINRSSKHLPADILDLIRRFTPYRAGDSLLWALNEARNQNTHALLTPFALQVPQGGVGWGTAAGGSIQLGPGGIEFHRPKWNGEKREFTLATVSADSQINCGFSLSYHIAFAEIPVLEGQPAIAILHQMLSKIEVILVALEAETRRLFPERF